MREGNVNGLAYLADRWPPDPARSTILFIHGAGGSKVLWREQIDTLGKRVNTIALDLPGHGESPGAGCREIVDYARCVADWIRETGIPGPIPCGLSMGGAITQQLLLDHPESWRAGILVSTGARLRVMPAILETVESDYRGYLEAFPSFAASEKTDPERLRPILEAAEACSPKVVAGDFEACDAFDVMERLDSIDLPVLVVSAEDDKLTPPKYGAFLEQAIPGARRVHIPDAGHLVPAERPDVFNRAVEGFLDEAGL